MVFSALGRRGGAPAGVLAWAVAGSMIASEELLDEYRRVLEQPRALDFSGLSLEQVRDFLVALRTIVDLRRLPAGRRVPIPATNIFGTSCIRCRTPSSLPVKPGWSKAPTFLSEW